MVASSAAPAPVASPARAALPRRLHRRAAARRISAAADEVREALRELLVANTHGRAPAREALAALEEASARARFSVDFRSGRLFSRAEGVDGAVGRILAVV